MRSTVLTVMATLTIGLAGCFTAEQPLLTDDNSIAPYQTVSFNTLGSDEVTVLTRQGKAYVSTSEEGRVTVRFMALDRPDWFIVEANADDGNGRLLRNFALLKVDFTNRRAEAYKVFADDGDIRPGLHACDDDAVCIDDLDVFVALATTAADAGAAPDKTYKIKVT